MRLPQLGRRVLRRRGTDEGFALVTTVLAMAVLAAFSLVVLQQTITNTAAARQDQDWVAALGAAQAGVDDYIGRLNDSNGGYYTYSAATPDGANPAMGPVSGPPNWAPVPPAQDGEAARGFFHYDVDNTTYTGTATTPPNGNLVVTSTGRVGTRTRTLRATVRRAGFMDYVYFTDLETPDPLSLGASSTDPAVAACAQYWPVRPGPDAPPPGPRCHDASFHNDRLTGPVHSNDTMLICDGNQFLDAVTTASGPVTANGNKHFRTNYKSTTGLPLACGDAGTTTYHRPGDPQRVRKISLPPTNLALRKETGIAAPSPAGCLYVGPTRITIKGARLKVLSPWTKAPTPGCPANDSEFALPANGVVYVDVVPASNSGDVNAPAASQTCPTTPYAHNGVFFPAQIGGKSETGWTYPCKAGDVFVSQESSATALDGRLTVSAQNNIYVTGDIEYKAGSAGSFLGLIAEQFLYVWHPLYRDDTNTLRNLLDPADRRISAAMLSVNHSVTVQNPTAGAAVGTLRVTGAITAKYRGVMGSGGGATGYLKDYQYDQRLRYDAPPRFLNPLISSFGTVRTAETTPAYR